MLEVVTRELIAARPIYRRLAPGPVSLLRGSPSKVVRLGKLAWSLTKDLRKKTPLDDVASGYLSSHITSKILTRPVMHVRDAHLNAARIHHDFWRKNGMGGRSWLYAPKRTTMVIVFHDANKAGPHVDVHIDRVSLVYRVKPDTYERLRYNNDGELTEDSKKLLIAHLRSEIENGSRVAQNLDHTKTGARTSWTLGGTDGTAYGAGPTRQVISCTTIDVAKAHDGGPIELYAPVIDPQRSLYVYRIYPGAKGSAPICIFGAKQAHPPALEDRLHLKMIDPSNFDKAARDLDLSTSTAKYDGSSCYVVIGPKGTTVWSPRTSAKTGRQIEYTPKLDGMAQIKNDQTIVAMGELLFYRKTWYHKKTYLPCATGSGILNANLVVPDGITPEIRLYRVDRIGRTSTKDLPFFENRALQERTAKLDPSHLQVVELMDPATAKRRGFEGVVVVGPHQSVNDGVKCKWWQDANDWRIDRVELTAGPKGGTAGVVWCTSLESHKTFKLGPGQIGNHELTDAMMVDPEAYTGAVIKVQSRHGHEGRAAKMVAFHDDKGVAIMQGIA